MLARTQKIASSRLSQLSSQLGLQTRTMATLNTQLPINTGAKIRECVLLLLPQSSLLIVL